jgi:hypothetical protein
MRQGLIARGDLRDFTYRRPDTPKIRNEELPWMFAPPSPLLLESRWK